MCWSLNCDKWKKQYLEGSLTTVAAGEDVVSASELAAAIKQINQLQRLPGKNHGS